MYLDIVRDRLYTTPAGSHARRSAQTALYHIAHAMVRWLAPVLSFTAEEIWRQLPGAPLDSVFMAQWHALPQGAAHDIDWTMFLQLKRDVSRELEKLREAQQIGAPLDAEVDVYCVPAEFERFNALGAELRFLLITSEAKVHKASAAPPGAVPATETGTRRGVARGAGICCAQVRALLAPPSRGRRVIRSSRKSAAAASRTSQDPANCDATHERRHPRPEDPVAHGSVQRLAVAAAGGRGHRGGSALQGLDC